VHADGRALDSVTKTLAHTSQHQFQTRAAATGAAGACAVSQKKKKAIKTEKE
jgi:hypothetical protein